MHDGPQLPWGMVLAGGKSTRLGRDKVLERVDGQPMLARMAELAGRHCRQVVVSGRDPAAQEAVPQAVRDLPWLPDEGPGGGPLRGISTCLRRLGGPLLVLACDLPLLDDATVGRLLEAHRHRPPQAVMTTFLQQATGFIEALVSVYEAEALPLLEAAAAAGMNKLSRAIPFERRHHIPYEPDQALVFFNINYPADLAMLTHMGMAGASTPATCLA
ncbi:molybdenum cofactor guanylyltransferase [Megalodesulfovibrio paquesii]